MNAFRVRACSSLAPLFSHTAKPFFSTTTIRCAAAPILSAPTTTPIQRAHYHSWRSSRGYGGSRMLMQSFSTPAEVHEAFREKLRDVQEGTEKAKVFMDKAQVFVDNEMYPEAIETYNTCLHERIHDIYKRDVVCARSMVYLLDEKTEALGVEDFENVLRGDPDHIKALCIRAHYRIKHKNTQGAIDDFTRAHSVSKPKDWRGELLLMRAEVHMSLGEYEKAIPDLDKQIHLWPKLVYGYERRAACYQKLDNPDKAMMDLNSIVSATQRGAPELPVPEDIVSKRPTNLVLLHYDALQLRANLNYSMKRYDDCIYDCDQLLKDKEVARTIPDTYLLRANAKSFKFNVWEPTNYSPNLTRMPGYENRMCNEVFRDLETYLKRTEQTTLTPQLRAAKGLWHFANGNFKSADVELRAAIDASGEDALKWRYALGQVLSHMKKTQLAIDIFTNLIAEEGLEKQGKVCSLWQRIHLWEKDGLESNKKRIEADLKRIAELDGRAATTPLYHDMLKKINPQSA